MTTRLLVGILTPAIRATNFSPAPQDGGQGQSYLDALKARKYDNHDARKKAPP
jgi:hypothetical protein